MAKNRNNSTSRITRSNENSRQNSLHLQRQARLENAMALERAQRARALELLKKSVPISKLKSYGKKSTNANAVRSTTVAPLSRRSEPGSRDKVLSPSVVSNSAIVETTSRRKVKNSPDTLRDPSKCKARPPSSSGGGGSRPFVPWCDRKS